MVLNIEKINNIAVKAIEVKEPSFPCNPELFPFWFQVVLLVGNRGFGKTTLALNMLELEKNYIDMVYVISPNAKTDLKVMKVLDTMPHKLYDTLTEDVVEDIKNDIDRRIQLYNDGKRLQKLLAKLPSVPKAVEDSDIEFIERLDENTIPEMFNLLRRRHPPTSVLWIDDQVGTSLIHRKEGELVKMVIKNRHRYLTCMLGTQNLKSISPPIRKCASVLFIAPTMDKKYRQDIFTELEGVVKTFDIFNEIMDEVNKNPYQFLSVFNNGKQSDLRINLDRKITL